MAALAAVASAAAAAAVERGARTRLGARAHDHLLRSNGLAAAGALHVLRHLLLQLQRAPGRAVLGLPRIYGCLPSPLQSNHAQ
eukprot:scaffold3440_cov316-Prasinococcus_capsulatus_cf.AAC.5